ncbi:hypothetical protein M433DRAFT_8628 [Acidomyces richmondensis BFW]|nr:hypothetical protein M433DRAFT_8628 [Acidomyces richmondensis BFW]
MASRRAPLANVPNAVNSPIRGAAVNHGKRTRAGAGDAGYGQPPAKKQVIELVDEDGENVDPRKRNVVAAAVPDRVDEAFGKRSNAQPTALERKLVAAREKKPAPTPQSRERTLRTHADNIESIRQWQRHYRKQFPNFVIYFDSVPDDIRAKTLRQIHKLEAREEKFFSKSVTHVVTTRQIPPELSTTSPTEDAAHESVAQKSAQTVASAHGQDKTTNLLNAHLQKRTQAPAGNAPLDVDPRKVQLQPTDILSRARQLGIKIWALEKLHRILNTILDGDVDDQPTVHDTRSHIIATRNGPKAIRDGDLEQMLRNEKVNGPADRDMTVTGQDMTTFRGCYIYVHDMDEKTKPVMARDYNKPAVKEQGKWPQFRLTPAGRCPFVEDPAHTKRLQQQEAAAKAQDDIAAASRKTRAASAQEAVAVRGATSTRALAERNANLRRSPRKLDAISKPLDPPKAPGARRQSSAEGMPPLFGSAQQTLRGLPRMVGGEPIASGVQPSNVTSAIRSQYVSSAAISSTAPGASYRVGDTKEVSMLKRKVLERGANVNSNHSMPSSYMNDMRAAINNNDHEPPPRAAKRKAQETLGVVHEDDEIAKEPQRAKQGRTMAPKKRKSVERDPKPGYCENCRDKFDDFDEHIQSRKHRKFALNQENWKELDGLLAQLKRPHKDA